MNRRRVESETAIKDKSKKHERTANAIDKPSGSEISKTEPSVLGVVSLRPKDRSDEKDRSRDAELVLKKVDGESIFGPADEIPEVDEGFEEERKSAIDVETNNIPGKDDPRV